jgi:hypothetical protein
LRDQSQEILTVLQTRRFSGTADLLLPGFGVSSPTAQKHYSFRTIYATASTKGSSRPTRRSRPSRPRGKRNRDAVIANGERAAREFVAGWDWARFKQDCRGVPHDAAAIGEAAGATPPVTVGDQAV